MPDTILRPPAGCPPQMFGAAIAAYGDRLLIGAPCLDYLMRLDEGIPAPAAALFVRAGSGWADCAVVHAAEPASAEGFGRSVALTDRFAIVGAPGHETGDAAAYVFRRNGNSLAPHAALPSVRKSATCNVRIIEKCRSSAMTSDVDARRTVYDAMALRAAFALA